MWQCVVGCKGAPRTNNWLPRVAALQGPIKGLGTMYKLCEKWELATSLVMAGFMHAARGAQGQTTAVRRPRRSARRRL